VKVAKVGFTLTPPVQHVVKVVQRENLVQLMVLLHVKVVLLENFLINLNLLHV